MRIQLSQEAVAVLNNMLRQPMQLPLGRAGMTQPSGMPKEFQSPDPSHAKKVAALRKWLESKVMESEKDEKDKVTGYKFVAHNGCLMQSYVDVVNDLLKFYQPVGMLVEMSTVYSELVDVFSGKIHKLDSLEAMTFDEEAVEKKKE